MKKLLHDRVYLILQALSVLMLVVYLLYTNGFQSTPVFISWILSLILLLATVVYSAVNELSFAYNTDTAGLNTYLGYAVTIGKTSYVSEFEYAAQMVCKEGAGSYAVVATDYGWHIIYCTFAYMEGDLTPFVYDAAQEDEEGTFSNLFYEAFRSQIVEQYSTRAQREAISTYDDGITLYKDRYADLSGLDTAD